MKRQRTPKGDSKSSHKMSMRSHLIRQKGNLLQSNADYIVHQANCCLTDGRAAGVAKSIFEEWEYSNIYTPQYKNRNRA